MFNLLVKTPTLGNRFLLSHISFRFKSANYVDFMASNYALGDHWNV